MKYKSNVGFFVNVHDILGGLVRLPIKYFIGDQLVK